MDKSKKEKKPRCPKGTRRNKKTGECEQVNGQSVQRQISINPPSVHGTTYRREVKKNETTPTPSPKQEEPIEPQLELTQTQSPVSSIKSMKSQTSQTSNKSKKSRSKSPKSPKSVSKKRESPKTSKSPQNKLTSLFQKTQDGYISYMCIDYPTEEHAYQAQKYKCSNKPELAVKLFSVKTTKFKTAEDAKTAGEPEEMKKHGAEFDEMCWNNMLRDLS